ncbi:MAG: glycosyltransferase family 4 protein [Alphaproteobacteria bacterium]
MTACVFAIPGDITTPTGGYRYDREVLARVGAHGVAMTAFALPGSFPIPTEADLAETKARLGDVKAPSVLLIDGLAYGALPRELIAELSAPIVALVHHPLGHETGTPADQAARLIENERQALAEARAVIVTHARTAVTLRNEFDVPAEKITVAEPGTEPRPQATGSGQSAPALLAVGAISKRKGYDVLIRALSRLADRPWSLTIVGATDRDPTTVSALKGLISELKLEARIRFTGSLDEEALNQAYRQADIFVLASHYEGYGMVLAEALAYGLPIVTTTVGVTENVPDDAALKVPPADPERLAEALGLLIDNPHRRAALASGARLAGQALPGWDDTARLIATVIQQVGTQEMRR